MSTVVLKKRRAWDFQTSRSPAGPDFFTQTERNSLEPAIRSPAYDFN
jgi:hypothetical protein